MMKELVLAVSMTLLVASSTPAQTSAAASALDRQQEKVAALMKDFLSANDAIETRIDEAVSALSSLRDSPDSGTKVADAKMDVIQDLTANVEKYRTRRLTIEDRLRQSASAWDPETLKRVEAFLDGKIEKRVDQILELVNSVKGSAGSSAKPTVLREDGWGNIREVEDTSDKAYKQDQKLDKRATQVQEETRETLEKRILDIENQIRTLKSQAASTADAERKAELQRQAADYEARLAAAKNALSTVGETQPGTGTLAVDPSSEAQKLSMKLKETTARLKAEQVKVEALGAQLMNELARLDSLKAAAAQP